ncbi:alpha-amylase family glycosyl hydrolase [Undibacterium cyanobacteriorum]|uniref:Alpha-amylase family glycosyl hydrolase n=1 Tax=Undibacterium cyanobacteriorum TaxID=3073561 RepID=A0ABY9RFL9_9BURK|nr:alpha-amylase family glycosyl hydrolase [Undibacterium sp. 20NA77.5]WMW79741.1 alpha-amylase family glycosyl hydrolase [Undibacterium sp. 20NA77.5]
MNTQSVNQDWWREAVIYQVYPRSFMDSNGDGIGDLPGITSRLDYIASLGVDIVWISPFFKSPMKDFGYDVSDYCDVDPLFGKLADFDALVKRAHELGLKIMIDQVLSHTAETHPWFAESRSSRTNPKADWYVWADPQADGTPPNNWLSIFGGSAWQWDTRRCQYYLHNFLVSQPDMNFHHPEVQDAHLRNMRFWLERGVDGFRMDACIYHFHDLLLRNNPVAAKQNTVNVAASNPYGMQAHIYDNSRPENLGFLERVRTLLDEFQAISIGEIGADDALEVMAQYTEGNKRLHMAYSFNLLTAEFSAAHIRRQVEAFEQRVKDGGASWSVGNHDVPRVMSRWGGEGSSIDFAKMILTMQLALKGTPCLYQGDELALSEAQLAYEDLQDPVGLTFWPESKGRDGCRTPIPWESSQEFAGFSSHKPWLPIPHEHRALGVSKQEQQSDSMLQFARRVIRWRKSIPQLLRGAIVFIDTPEPVLAFRRVLQGAPEVVVAFNLSATPVQIQHPELQHALSLNGHGLGGVVEGDALSLPAWGAWFGLRH